MTDERDPPTLRIRIDASHPLRADLVARIVERLDNSFVSYQRRRNRGFAPSRFRIVDVHVGSIIADLISVAEALDTLRDQRELLGGFMAQLAHAVEWLTGVGGVKKPSAADRDTVNALAAPIANDNARQTCVQIIGDNNNVVVITPETVEALRTLRESGFDLREATAPRKDPPVEARVEEAEAALEDARHQVTEAAIRSYHGSGFHGTGFLGTTQRRREGVRDASLHHFDGQWYARPAELSGVMLPVQNQAGLPLTPGVPYNAEGAFVRSSSIPTGFIVSKIIAMARGSA